MREIIRLLSSASLEIGFFTVRAQGLGVIVLMVLALLWCFQMKKLRLSTGPPLADAAAGRSAAGRLAHHLAKWTPRQHVEVHRAGLSEQYAGTRGPDRF